MHLESLLTPLKSLLYHVGQKLLTYYDSAEQLKVDEKANHTPVTDADRAAHQLITDYLTQLTPDIPILSEEGEIVDYATRQSWRRCWLVDPLDGTKEFLAKTGEFSINIALIENHQSVLGLVYAPILQTLYYTMQGHAYKITPHEIPQLLKTKPVGKTLRIAISRHHHGSKLSTLLKKLDNYELIEMGSALKLCLIAEGGADVYIRLGPTSEWDTAAGQHILECAGGKVTDLDLHSLRYNYRDTVKNPAFLAVGDTEYDWEALLRFLIKNP